LVLVYSCGNLWHDFFPNLIAPSVRRRGDGGTEAGYDAGHAIEGKAGRLVLLRYLAAGACAEGVGERHGWVAVQIEDMN
jgi:hypothetical protein